MLHESKLIATADPPKLQFPTITVVCEITSFWNTKEKSRLLGLPGRRTNVVSDILKTVFALMDVPLMSMKFAKTKVGKPATENARSELPDDTISDESMMELASITILPEYGPPMKLNPDSRNTDRSPVMVG